METRNNKRTAIFLGTFGVLSVLCGYSFCSEPCRSGLQTGQRPGPYSAVIVTGPQRGQSYCYICETADCPAVVVFARTLSEPLGKLVRELDRSAAEHQAAKLRAWVTLLGYDQAGQDAKVVRWAQQHAIRNVPIGIFEDAGGPPSYRLARDADVTILLFVRRQVVCNFAFRSDELAGRHIDEVVKALTSIVR